MILNAPKILRPGIGLSDVGLYCFLGRGAVVESIRGLAHKPHKEWIKETD